MVKSMTGYGRSKKLVNGRDITVEVKSVNSRYLDTNIKMSKLYNPLEDKIKQMASACISRGKLDIYVAIDNMEGESISLSLNREFLESFLEQLGIISSEYGVGGSPDINMIACKNDVFIMKKLDEDMNIVWIALEEVLKEALDAFNKMRCTEGDKLKTDISGRVAVLNKITDEISILAPKSVEENNLKMTERVRELLNGTPVDEQRLLTECAVHADKSDITEELVRLKSHFGQLEDIFEENIPIGRKIDFLLQEINREINTIGSKSNNIQISKHVIEAKSELEKIREQIQNIE